MLASYRGIGAVADLTDMIPADMKNSFLPTALSIISNSQGHIDALPQEGCTWALFYSGSKRGAAAI